MPMAVMRPSSRLAKSHRMSASLIGPAGPFMIRPVVVAAAARIDDDPLAGQPRTGAADQLLLADRVRGAAGDPRAEEVQGAQRFRAADAVGIQPVLALVGHQPVVRLQAEVAVDQAGVEAEILQAGLQRGDVVAVHRGAELVRQRAGAQPVGRLLAARGRSPRRRCRRPAVRDAVGMRARPGRARRRRRRARRACRWSGPSSGLSISPSAASAARISVTAPPRSPRRRLDIARPLGDGCRAVAAVASTSAQTG